jgi:hypothetical protein
MKATPLAIFSPFLLFFLLFHFHHLPPLCVYVSWQFFIYKL